MATACHVRSRRGAAPVRIRYPPRLPLGSPPASRPASMPAPTSAPIVVLFGSPGSERRVSFASTQHIAQQLPEARLWFWGPDGAVFELDAAQVQAHERPFEVDFPTEGRRPLAPDIQSALEAARDLDATLLLGLHGGEGENGELAERCEALGLPFTGSGSAASKRAFDKVVAKGIADGVGARVLPSLALSAGEMPADLVLAWFDRHGALIAKPTQDGSSVGLQFLRSRTEVERFIQTPVGFPTLIEPCISGVEGTVGVIDTPEGPRPLEPVEIRPAPGQDFDFSSKYLDPQTQELCPSTFPDALKAEIMRAATAVHTAIGAEGYSRTDFIMGPEGPVFLEINTLPGLTQQSLLPKELRFEGIVVRDFLLGLIAQARARTARDQPAG